MHIPNVDVRRRHLPHWHASGSIQFVTLHLADSLPRDVRERLIFMKDVFYRQHPQPWDAQTTDEFNSSFPKKYDQYLDAGYGSCCLRKFSCSKIMEDVILHFNYQRYILHHYVIMPNHVHILVELLGSNSLDAVSHSWKSYSANMINCELGATGKLWHHESWDRLIRDEEHYRRVVAYIDDNIQAGGIRWMSR